MKCHLGLFAWMYNLNRDHDETWFVCSGTLSSSSYNVSYGIFDVWLSSDFEESIDEVDDDDESDRCRILGLSSSFGEWSWTVCLSDLLLLLIDDLLCCWLLGGLEDAISFDLSPDWANSLVLSNEESIDWSLELSLLLLTVDIWLSV